MLKTWCANQGFCNATNLSHVLMDGGKLSVPFDRLNEFYEKYIEAVKSGEKIYVVEQKTETYNFFVDIDYKAPEPLGIDEIHDISKIICDTVKSYGGRECLVSVALPRKCGDVMKTGIHLNWPNFVVDQETAVTLRQYILMSLSKSKSSIDWGQIIDSSVYGCAMRKTKGSGFRMPWSYKMAKHDACEGRGCTDCVNGKMTYLPYLPLFRYTREPFSTLLRIDQEPSVEILKMSAVRTDAPKNVMIDLLSPTRKEGSFTEEQTKDEVHDEELKSKVEAYIRKNLEGQGDAYITKIFRHKNCFLVSTTSRYCENLKRKHNSNHVWFIISGRVILQKCFCDCPTLRGRKDGFCKDFCGRRHELTKEIVNKLYPEKEELVKCPEIKKFVEKPQVNIKSPLETFMNRNMKVDEGTSILDVKREKGSLVVLTTSNYCETSNTSHESKLMSYVIKKNQITQKCPICKRNRSRTHVLPPNVVKLLKQ